ncbi:hypothetical protein [Haloarcula litorea]|uniref:hypothetical protein n=1 Tax=Haloarcula litorea TaxID=3032579 RepID=UPI0023E79F7A|nr:hypothetical protein [Halomicroarcula sp. GDY20]
MRDEVTRVEAVTYLEGASGHAVVSTLFLCLAGGLWSVGRRGVGTVALVIAYGVSVNGLSMYLWDAVRERVRSAAAADDAGPTRELTAHRLSTETKADVLGGFVLVGGFVAVAVATLVGFRALDLGWRASAAVAGTVLAAGNLGALAAAIRAGRRG